MASHHRLKGPTIVQSGTERYGWLFVVLALALVLGGLWLAYDYGRTSAGFDHAAAREEIAALKQRINGLEAERAELRQQAAALERASQIDREAVRQVTMEIKGIQDERLEMEEELLFLRGIVSNETGKGGLRIQNFKLAATAEEGMYHYSFTVSQFLNNLKTAMGRIWITLDGVREGKRQSLPLKALTRENVESLEMRFKHFQKIEGLIRLPQGFAAESMEIDIKPASKKLSRLTKTFKWSPGG